MAFEAVKTGYKVERMRGSGAAAGNFERRGYFIDAVRIDMFKIIEAFFSAVNGVKKSAAGH